MSIATDGGTRPSRRARGAVNYAEPSLNVKMRRPDKKMVDAVTGLPSHHSRAKSASGLGDSTSIASIVKDEPVDGIEAVEKWRDLPPAACGSPLQSKRKGTDSARVASPTEAEGQPATETARPMPAASRKRRQPGPTTAQPTEDLNSALKKLEELDLYDNIPTDSSPATDGSGENVKTHRRHSSMPKTGEELVKEKGGALAAPSRVGGARAASRRRSMML